MAHAAEITVMVNLIVTLDGEPVSHMLEAPATLVQHREPGAAGLTVVMRLDGARFAKALAPHFAAEIRRQVRMRGN